MQHHLMSSGISRRNFLQRAGLGCGSLALTELLHQQGILAAPASRNPLAGQASHFAPRARAVIWLFQTGSPSQVDTFDYKPELQKRNGTQLAGADPKTGFFTTSGKCLKSPFEWAQHGESDFAECCRRAGISPLSQIESDEFAETCMMFRRPCMIHC